MKNRRQVYTRQLQGEGKKAENFPINTQVKREKKRKSPNKKTVSQSDPKHEQVWSITA